MTTEAAISTPNATAKTGACRCTAKKHPSTSHDTEITPTKTTLIRRTAFPVRAESWTHCWTHFGMVLGLRSGTTQKMSPHYGLTCSKTPEPMALGVSPRMSPRNVNFEGILGRKRSRFNVEFICYRPNASQDFSICTPHISPACRSHFAHIISGVFNEER
jgi:hypothetical protein